MICAYCGNKIENPPCKDCGSDHGINAPTTPRMDLVALDRVDTGYAIGDELGRDCLFVYQDGVAIRVNEYQLQRLDIHKNEDLLRLGYVIRYAPHRL